MVARKTAYCATGSYGTVAWNIHDADRSLFVMWSAPFNSDFDSNWLGVGITEPGHRLTPRKRSFDVLYYQNPYSIENAKYVKGEYFNNGSTIVVSDDLFEVHAVMSTNHHATASIQFLPKTAENLADKLKPEKPS